MAVKKEKLLKIISVLAGVAALVSLFLDWEKLSNAGLAKFGQYAIGDDGSDSFFTIMQEGGLSFVSVLTVIAIVAFVIFYLLNCLKLATLCYAEMIGVIAGFYYLMSAANEQWKQYSYAFGFILFVIATLVELGLTEIAKSEKKKRKKEMDEG